MAKNISFDDHLTEQLKDSKYKDDAESDQLKSTVALTKERERVGLTQRELAGCANVLQAAIARVEHGHNTSFDTMIKISVHLGRNSK